MAGCLREGRVRVFVAGGEGFRVFVAGGRDLECLWQAGLVESVCGRHGGQAGLAFALPSTESIT